MNLPEFLGRLFHADPATKPNATCTLCGYAWHADLTPDQRACIIPIECPWCGNQTGQAE